MPRWDYDTVFYRVFCFTLLGIACAFTVILTNVFIDIDGLLYKKNAGKTDLERVDADAAITTNFEPENIQTDDDYKEYGDTYDVQERTKRSLDTQDFSFHVKDPKVQKIITDRLAALLEDIDKKANTKMNHKENIELKNKLLDEVSKRNVENNAKYTEYTVQNNNVKNHKDVELLDIDKNSRENFGIEILDDIERIKKQKNDKQKLNQTENELKHLAMHNIILQGIIGHKDLGEVYTKVHLSMNNLEKNELNKDKLEKILNPDHDKLFFNELMNCKQLKEQILSETTKVDGFTTPQTRERKLTSKPKGRNVMIKTIIDISSIANDRTYQEDASKENVNGIIKLIYNGKSLKFRRVDDTTLKPVVKQTNEKSFADSRLDINANIKEVEDRILSTDGKDTTYVPKLYMNKIINEYLRKYSQESDSLENTRKLTTKRLKRHIQIRYNNDKNFSTTTKKPTDDELYVEIETHFDSKGLKGEKKKKMIRELIEKIQKAIRSDKQTKKKTRKHLHVKKRFQNPLDNGVIEHKLIMPLEHLIYRELDPISKSVPPHEQLPLVSDGKGDNWSKNMYGPRYFSLSKGINSAEMSELDTDYNQVMDNGIPQRLQQPMKTDSKPKTLQFDPDPLNSKYVMRGIGDSGFTIGFNQYVDAPPDAESIKLFSGIENILKTYHQQYDQDNDAANIENTDEDYTEQKYVTDENATNQDNPEPETDQHTIVRRSTQNIKRDYHSNEYKVIFDNNFLNFDDYKDVLNVKTHWSLAKNKANRKKPSIVTNLLNGNIFSKDLKPAEIFNLANILDRKKRTMHVEKFSKIKHKTKMNRYINTKPMASKKIFQHNRRNKRQINKIRIIAKDISNQPSPNSNEDIFIFSDEKIFADRAVIKQEMPNKRTIENLNSEQNDMSPNKHAEHYYDPQTFAEDHYDVISSLKDADANFDNQYAFVPPYISEPPPIEADDANNYFAKISRHNLLMSKYPHVFMEAPSKEDYVPEIPQPHGKVMDKIPARADVPTQNKPALVELPQYMQEQQSPLQDIASQYPLQDKDSGNYKVTVKILPKNNTDPNTFKEIHTTFNKTYNKNGLVYTSLVNVSEISKVEEINKTKQYPDADHVKIKKLNKDHLKMKTLIRQHKDRIKEQLAHLNTEKEKLELIDKRTTGLLRDDNKDYIDLALSSHSGQILHLTKEDLNRLFKLQETTTKEPTTTTTTIPTTVYMEPVTENSIKLKLFDTIERNEYMTNAILKKIDKNTDVLQSFLDKIMNRLEPVTTKKPEEVYTNPEIKTYKEANPQKLKTDEIYEIPNIIFNQMTKRNGTRGIPFVYAFQQPYTMPNSDNKDASIANVVYQGHIHANTINRPQADNIKLLNAKADIVEKVKEWKPTPVAGNNEKNGTKFFIDDIDNNDFKVIPAVDKTGYSINLANLTKV